METWRKSIMGLNLKSLPLPPFYDPGTASGTNRLPYGELEEFAANWKREHGIRPARFDEFTVLRLGIDVQDTFSLATGELPVKGAVEDLVRASEFDYRYAHVITKRWESMDSHQLFQIFHGVYWLDRNDGRPKSGTLLMLDDVLSGNYRVNPDVAWNLRLSHQEVQDDAVY